jgi:ATP-dependent RNA helicase DDX24/MAK5
MNNSKKKKKGGLKKKATTVEGAIAEILEKSRAKGPTKVIDLTSAKKIGFEQQVERAAETGATTTAPTTAAVPSSSRLPDGLSLYKIECTKKHKDSHLYAYLVTTAQGASGPCLVFCNSIAAVHRVSATLRTLRLPVRSLHANMPQVLFL